MDTDTSSEKIGLVERKLEKNRVYNRLTVDGKKVVSEINLQPYDVVFFYPTELIENKSAPNYDSDIDFGFGSESKESEPVYAKIAVQPPTPDTNVTLSQMVSKFLSYVTENKTEARLVDHFNTNISGMPGYQFVYYDYTGDKTRKWLAAMVLHNGEWVVINYVTEPGYFDKYLADVTRMLDTFEIYKK